MTRVGRSGRCSFSAKHWVAMNNNNGNNNSSKSGSAPGTIFASPMRRGGGDTDTLRDALLELLHARQLRSLVGEGESTLPSSLRHRDGTPRAYAVRSEEVIRPDLETNPLGVALPHADPNSPGYSVADPNMMRQMQQIGRRLWSLDELVPQRESQTASRAELLVRALEEAVAITSGLHPYPRSTLPLLLQANRRSRSLGTTSPRDECLVASRPTMADCVEESIAIASSSDFSGITDTTASAQQDPAERDTQQEQ